MTDERKAYYWLGSSGLSAKKARLLLEIYGSPSEIMSAAGREEKLREFCGNAYDALVARADEELLTRELREIKSKGIRVIVPCSEFYPERLSRSMEYPPVALFAKGNCELLTRPSLAMVGSRASTDYGRRVATEWAAELSEKFTIVSGHATGIDTYALGGTLSSGGSAISVLACGHDKFDVPAFMKNSSDRVLLIGEYPPGRASNKFVYHERNRLISGLSDGVVIVEAGEKSGALITARAAAEQGKPLFAVPGSVFSTRCAGTNALLRGGATAACSPSDILEDMGYETRLKESVTELTGSRAKVAELLRDGDAHFDDIAEKLGMSAGEAAELLGEMELEGLIERKMMNRYSLLVR